ncbi:MAG TPA: AMP-binding protein [Terriglobales bacterium]|nr:AMP-binding protein [Terriglobales bacterium]
MHGTSLCGRFQELSGRSVLIATRDQLAAALALIELDGVAARLIVCPPDISKEHLPSVLAKGGVDAIVSDHGLPDHDLPDHADPVGILRVRCSCGITPTQNVHNRDRPTEWVLLTSGTTGAPKMVVHSFGSLSAPIKASQSLGTDVVWGTFYDIRRYGGLQILLRALLGRGSLLLSSTAEPVPDYLLRLGARGVTHISGTSSHWRRALMSSEARAISPRYIRLSGEIADQSILNTLRSFYPQAGISHAFASTEAGVAFEVTDCFEGFPANLVRGGGEVEIKMGQGSLRIRSARTALRYLGSEDGMLADKEGYVDTGDIVELRGDRYYFLGRRNGVVNIGGLKVHPEEVEAVINRHPAVRMSAVRPRRNPITGSVLAAEVILQEGSHEGSAESQLADVKREILAMCRDNLPAHKVPVTIRCVPSIEVAATGKTLRQYA